MNCPKCQQPETKVVDSRSIDNCIRRRRECSNCHYRFTTFEAPQIENLKVQKRNGSIEPFDRNKIIKSLSKACNKRPIDPDKISSLSYEIEHELYCKHSDLIPSRSIGKKILEKLLNLDKVAYLRFASVYKNFKSINTFSKEIDRLSQLEN